MRPTHGGTPAAFQEHKAAAVRRAIRGVDAVVELKRVGRGRRYIGERLGASVQMMGR